MISFVVGCQIFSLLAFSRTWEKVMSQYLVVCCSNPCVSEPFGDAKDCSRLSFVSGKRSEPPKPVSHGLPEHIPNDSLYTRTNQQKSSGHRPLARQHSPPPQLDQANNPLDLQGDGYCDFSHKRRGEAIESDSGAQLDHRYERRPRHKTKADKYEPGEGAEAHRKHRDDRHRIVRRKRKRRSAAVANHNFRAPNVPPNRLTVSGCSIYSISALLTSYVSSFAK